ncbi:MAG: ECF transporter S component [Bacillota bacterium]
MENVTKKERNTALQTDGRSMSTRTLVSLGMLGAISIVLASLVHFPLMPAAPFLEYDPADIPILIGTFAFGAIPGLVLTIVVSIIQGMTVSAGSGYIGIIMHVVATGAFVLSAGMIYQRNKTVKTAMFAVAVGVIAQTIAMVGMNLILTPIFMGTAVEVVIGMLVPIIIPFNLMKAGINGILTFVLYKKISAVLRLK